MYPLRTVIGIPVAAIVAVPTVAPAATTEPVPVTTAGGSCVANGTKTYANGTTIWSLCYPPGPASCPLGRLISQWTCSNGQWVKSQ
jgi:hypothetical protein